MFSEDTLRRFLNGDMKAGDKDEYKNCVLNDYWILPVQAYIHSGVSLTLESFAGKLPGGHYEFDVSRCGFVLAAKKEFRTRKQAYKIAKGLIESWNMYLAGDVYCCVVEYYDNDKEQENYDVCCGFYGFESAKEELKNFRG
jgi:hypothetical protein